MRLVDVNLRAVMLATQLAIRAMREQGRGGAIVNIASLAGVGNRPHPDPDYAATKAGVVRFSTALAPLSSEGIRVNCVCPDWVDTPMSRRTRANMTEEELRTKVPPVLLAPEEIADAVMELVHDDSLAGRVMACFCGAPRKLFSVDEY
jgi:NAD(P)-dependent dehydrogenase (short-subunit alcohol dehydrogenase family)